MSWFRSDPPARVDADSADTLVITTAEGDMRNIRLLKLNWIAFANIGDSFLANENGWWLLGDGAGATGIWYECPVVDTAMRGPLAAAVDAVGDLAILHLADTPKMLRSAQRNGGVIEFDAAALDALRSAAAIEPVQSVRAVPLLP